MILEDFIIIFVLVVILGGAIFYIRKEKKRGVACIGCSSARECAKKRNGEKCECNQ